MRYFNAFCYKEWIKLKSVAGLLLAANICFALYLCLKLRYVGNFYDGEQIWGSWISKAYLFYTPYRWLPLISGTLLGFLQFHEESKNHRIRLLFHLPLNEEKAILWHELIGLALMLATVLPALLVFAVFSTFYFPAEFLGNLVITSFPWLIGGVFGYLFMALFQLEGHKRYRVVYLLLGYGLIRQLYYLDFYDTYTRILPHLSFAAVLFLCLPLLSSFRYRKGLSQ